MNLFKFLKQRDIIYTLCAASFASQIVSVADTLTNSCIIPILNKKEYNNIENFTMNVNGAKIEIGKILIVFIRIFLIIIILLIIYYLTYQ